MTAVPSSRILVPLIALVCASTMSAQILVVEHFDNNNAGWTLGTDWQIGAATASSGQQYNGPDPSVDGSGTAAGGVAGVVIGGNAPTALHGYYYLESPAINTAGAPSLFLNFKRWLNSDYTPYMQNSVEVFNGATWVTVFQTGASPGVNDTAWQNIQYDVSAAANAAFKVRFGYLVGSAGVFVVSSWNVDDVVVSVGGPGAYTHMYENFNTHLGWTAGPEWAFGPATASPSGFFNGDPGTDGDGVAGGPLAGVVLGGNYSTTLHAASFLTSPGVDVSTTPGTVLLSYDRFLNCDYPPYMQHTVQVFDGANWVTVYAVPGSQFQTDSTWVHYVHDVTAFKNNNMRVRFSHSVGSAGVIAGSGWNVDNVRIGAPATKVLSGAPCGAPAPTLNCTVPYLGSLWTIGLSGGIPNDSAFLLAGGIGAPTTVLGSPCVIDINPIFLYLLMPLDGAGNGTLSFPLPDSDVYQGVGLSLQAVLLGPGGLSTSNDLTFSFGRAG